jgi:uncharacterized protein YecE (DUF72 family)
LVQLFLGTGGFSNDDWVGLLYPPTAKKTDWIGIYAKAFNAVEVNSTFYAVPGQKTFTSMLERSGGGLTFCVKLHRSFTHEREADKAAADRFRFTIDPARQAGRLGPLLAQFPYSFKNGPDGRAHLANLAEWFEGLELAVEFRHASWERDPIREYLADLGLSLVSVDLPDLRGLPAPATYAGAPYAYVRLHGRNAGQWFDAQNAADRHDYLYTPAELEGWVRAIRGASPERAFVFFQNTTRGQALENARQFRELWEGHEKGGGA